MARDATAIYVDDTSVEILSVSGHRARKWASAPLDPGLVRDGVILHQPEVATVIRKLYSDSGFSGGRVVAGISGINCLYRTLILPSLPKNLLTEAVRREAGRALGVSVEQLYLAWQDMPSPKDEKPVFLAAAPKESVDALIATLKRAGLNPYMMDLRPLAIARAAQQQSAIVVDLQPTSLDIVIKVGRVPEVVRSVPISRTMAFEGKLPIVKQELERAVSFYNSVRVEQHLPDDVPVLVSGELAEHQDQWSELGGARGRQIELLTPPLDNASDFESAQYITTTGLAFKETVERGAVNHSLINFNALPDAYRPKPRPLADILYPPALLIGVLAVLFVGYLVVNGRLHTDALRTEWEATTELAISMRADVGERQTTLRQEREDLAGATTRQEARATSLDRLDRGFSLRADDVNFDLGEVNNTPDGVDLDTVEYQGNNVIITGWGDTEASVFSYARQLRASGRFGTIDITRVAVEDVKMAFEFVLTNEPPSVA
jgi:type IV pilus assembly protein PilM